MHRAAAQAGAIGRAATVLVIHVGCLCRGLRLPAWMCYESLRGLSPVGEMVLVLVRCFRFFRMDLHMYRTVCVCSWRSALLGGLAGIRAILWTWTDGQS